MKIINLLIKLYKNKKQFKQITSAVTQAGRSFTYSFLNTLMDAYIKPYLISKQGYHPNQTKWAGEVLNVALNSFLFSQSIVDIGLNLAIRNIIKPALLKIGFNVDKAEYIANQLAVVALFTQPIQILEVTSNMLSADLGRLLAYNVIRQLPKLREEPEVENNLIVDEERAINQPQKNNQSRATLRHRGK